MVKTKNKKKKTGNKHYVVFRSILTRLFRSFYRCQLFVLCRQRGTLHALRRNLLAIGIGRQAIQHVTRTCHANPQGAMFQCPANARAIGLHRV